MRVDEFVDAALYGPDGFYETGGRAGRRGASFVTSPETGPLFGAVLARALDAWWRDADQPDEWIVVDAGAGPGTLARAIRIADPACASALRLVSVERTHAQRARHRSGTDSSPTAASDSSSSDLPERADVIVANELLDNLPFGLLEKTSGAWQVVEVHDDGTTSPDTGGARVPVAAAAHAWVLDARRRLRPGGRLVCFDYAATTPELAARPWWTWLRAFAGHEQLDDPFVDPGSRDVTVVVPTDQLPPPDHQTTQAEWLARHGIHDLVEEGRAHWAEHAARPDLTAMRMRSRISEVAALTDPEALGGFWVGEWRA